MKGYAVLLVFLPYVLAHHCDPPYVHVHHHCLQVKVIKDATEGISWEEAREECKGDGGDLAIINTPELLQDVDKYIGDNFKDQYPDREYWVGGSGQDEEFTWIDGSVVDVTSPIWHPGRFLGTPSQRYLCLAPTSTGALLVLDKEENDSLSCYICEDRLA